MIATAPKPALQLATAAEPAALEAWLAGAVAGAQAVYASGPDLPRGAAGVVLVTRWVAEGRVIALSRRDRADPNRFLFLVQSVSKGCASPPVSASGPSRAGTTTPRRGRATSSASARKRAVELLDLLRAAAAAGHTCPSYHAAARAMGLPPTERGRQTARAAFRRLAREGKIEIAHGAPRTARVVTILAKGTAEGLSTSGGHSA